MSEKSQEVDRYLASLPENQREWIGFFVAYMRSAHPELEEVMSFQMPTYKLGSGKGRNYIAFSPAKNHIAIHSMDFEAIATLKEALKKPGKGKGCVHVAYGQTEEREILLKGVEDIIARRDAAAGGL